MSYGRPSIINGLVNQSFETTQATKTTMSLVASLGPFSLLSLSEGRPIFTENYVALSNIICSLKSRNELCAFDSNIITCIDELPLELLAVGFDNGTLRIIEEETGVVKHELRLTNGPIARIRHDAEVLYVLMAKTKTIVAIDLDFFNGSNNSNVLVDFACCYELPTEFEAVEDIQVLPRGGDYEWPETTDYSHYAPLLVVGRHPMMHILRVSPIDEAIGDPLNMASKYLSSKVSSWFGKSTAAPESPQDLLIKQLPRGHRHYTPILNEPDRTISRAIEVNNRIMLLQDSHHGRLLWYDFARGTVTWQLKGLRATQIIKVNEKLIIYYPKQSRIEIYSSEDGILLSAHKVNSTESIYYYQHQEELYYCHSAQNMNKIDLYKVTLPLSE